MTTNDEELIHKYAHDQLSPEELAIFKTKLNNRSFRTRAAEYARTVAILQAASELGLIDKAGSIIPEITKIGRRVKNYKAVALWFFMLMICA